MSSLLSAYGLTFRNEAPDRLKLPFAPVEDSAAPVDVTVQLGEVPKDLADAQGSNNCWQAAPGRFLFRDPPVGRFLAEEGARITVDPAPNASDEDLTLYLLGSVVSAVLKQRGFVTFHASAISVAGQGVLFAGPSGVGKSTLLAELMRRGYTALADDVSAVRLEADGGLTVVPGYARTRLWQETVDAFAHLDTDQALGHVRKQLPKFVLPLDSFAPGPVRLGGVFLLTGSREEAQPLARPDILAALETAGYRRRTVRPLGAHATQFRTFSQIARSVPVQRLSRPGPGFSVAKMADYVEARIAEFGSVPLSA